MVNWDGYVGEKEDSEESWKDIKNNSKKDELLEITLYRKQCAISKALRVSTSNLIHNWNIDGLTSIQGLVILQLVRRINDCEDIIPKKWWCESCKAKDIRINELVVRFRNMNESRNKNLLNNCRAYYKKSTMSSTDPEFGYDV